MTDVYARQPEHELFRESLRDFLEKEITPHIDAWEAAGEIPRWVWPKFGEMGYFGLCFPEAYGGQELDFWYQVIFIEELSRCNSAGFAAAMIGHPILALTHINESGSDFLKEKYLIPGIQGEKYGALAVTEPGAGSDVANLQTKAQLMGDHYQIDGSKTFITNGVLSDFIVVAVKTDPQAGVGGVSLVVVDRDTPGLSAQKLNKLGWHASDTGLIAFDEVKVGTEQLIGQAGMGFYYIMQRFALERLVMAVSGVAAAEYALEYTLQYMAERKAFGRNLNKFQVLRHRIAQLVAEMERAKTFNYTLAQAYNDGAYQVKECAMAKLLATQLSDKVMTECLQVFGGYGYMEDYKMARMFRDSRVGTIGGGSSEIMCEIIAKAVID